MLIGGLFIRPQFYGTATTETISGGGSIGHNGWNGDLVDNAISSHPWFPRGDQSPSTVTAGVFSFNDLANGGAIYTISHRTILSGY